MSLMALFPFAVFPGQTKALSDQFHILFGCLNASFRFFLEAVQHIDLASNIGDIDAPVGVRTARRGRSSDFSIFFNKLPDLFDFVAVGFIIDGKTVRFCQGIRPFEGVRQDVPSNSRFLVHPSAEGSRQDCQSVFDYSISYTETVREPGDS